MVVPTRFAGSPTAGSAFDDQYGTGLMTNSLGWVVVICKGAIHYGRCDCQLPGVEAAVIRERHLRLIPLKDSGLLCKHHRPPRRHRYLRSRSRKSSPQVSLPPATEKCSYRHTFTLDGTYKLEMEAHRYMLNTYCVRLPGQPPVVFRSRCPTLFSLIDPFEIDGTNNSIIQSGTVSAGLGGSNYFGGAAAARAHPHIRTPEGAADYCYRSQPLGFRTSSIPV